MLQNSKQLQNRIGDARDVLRGFRHQFSTHGYIPNGLENLLTPAVRRSWHRCYDQGLKPSFIPDQAKPVSPQNGHLFATPLTPVTDFIKIAGSILSYLESMVNDSSVGFILANEKSIIIRQSGGVNFRPEARRLGLLEGTCWSEKIRGTNAVGEAMSKHPNPQAAALRDYLLSKNFTLAGYKGRKLSFRPWDGQLRQPMVIYSAEAMLALAPFEEFMHETNELDSLGYDQKSTLCKKFTP